MKHVLKQMKYNFAVIYETLSIRKAIVVIHGRDIFWNKKSYLHVFIILKE